MHTKNRINIWFTLECHFTIWYSKTIIKHMHTRYIHNLISYKPIQTLNFTPQFIIKLSITHKKQHYHFFPKPIQQ